MFNRVLNTHLIVLVNWTELTLTKHVTHFFSFTQIVYKNKTKQKKPHLNSFGSIFQMNQSIKLKSFTSDGDCPQRYKVPQPSGLQYKPVVSTNSGISLGPLGQSITYTYLFLGHTGKNTLIVSINIPDQQPAAFTNAEHKKSRPPSFDRTWKAGEKEIKK